MWFFVSKVESGRIRRVLFRAENRAAAYKVANALGGVLVIAGGAQ